MASTRFTHSCGHDGRVDGRNRADADRKATYFAAQPCWDCRKAAEAAAAVLVAEAAGLPALTGTPKQIPYGESMRGAKLPALDTALAAMRASVARGVADEPQKAGQGAEVLDALLVMEGDTRADASAKFWLEAPAHDQAWREWIVGEIRRRGLAPTAMPAKGS